MIPVISYQEPPAPIITEPRPLALLPSLTATTRQEQHRFELAWSRMSRRELEVVPRFASGETVTIDSGPTICLPAHAPAADSSESQPTPVVAPPITTDIIDARAAEVIVERIADTAPISPMAGEAPRARTQTLDGVTNGAAAHDSPSIMSIISYDNPRLTSLPPLALEQFKLAAQRALDHALSYLLNEESLTDLKTNVSAFTLALQLLKGERPKGKTPLAGWGPTETTYGQSLKVSRMVRLLRACVEATIVEAQVQCHLGSYVYTDESCRYVFREWYGGDGLIVQARTPAGYTQGRMAFTRAEVEAARVAERDEMREARASAERNRSPFPSSTSRAQGRIDGLNDQLFQGLKNNLMSKGKVTSNA